jgi:hypothetical protein
VIIVFEVEFEFLFWAWLQPVKSIELRAKSIELRAKSIELRACAASGLRLAA